MKHLVQQLLLLYTQKNTLTQEDVDSDQVSIVIDRMILKGLGGLLYRNIDIFGDIELPLPILEKLKQSYYQCLVSNMKRMKCFETFHHHCSQNMIQVIPLKGTYTAEKLYGDMGLRNLSDVDLLYKASDFKTIDHILTSLQYVPKNHGMVKEEHGHHHIYTSGAMMFEMHYHVHGDQYEYNINIDSFWEQASEQSLHGMAVKCLSNEHLFIHTVHHLHHHLTAGCYSMSGFTDVYLMLTSNKFLLDYSLLRTDADRFSCTDAINEILGIIEKYFNLQLDGALLSHFTPKCVGRSEKVFLSELSHNELRKGNIVRQISKVKGWKSTLFHVKNLFFPCKTFMIQRYNIKNPKLYLLYYPLRTLIGIKKYIKLLGQNYRHL